MIGQKERKYIFLEAAMVVMIVYLLTLFATNVLDQQRMISLDEQLNEQKIRHEAFLSSSSFFEALGLLDCEASKQIILDEFEVIDDWSKDLNIYGINMLNRNLFNHEIRKKEYALIQSENLNKALTRNSICEEDSLFYILYFIDGDIFGFNPTHLILQQFQRTNQDQVLLYTFDINFYDDPTVNFLMEKYNVTGHGEVYFGNLSSKTSSISPGKLKTELSRLKND